MSRPPIEAWKEKFMEGTGQVPNALHIEVLSNWIEKLEKRLEDASGHDMKKKLATLDALNNQHFHQPEDNECAACGGLREFTRDAVCFRCSPEPEVVAIQDAIRKVVKVIGAYKPHGAALPLEECHGVPGECEDEDCPEKGLCEFYGEFKEEE